jgi:hypothetical protein
LPFSFFFGSLFFWKRITISIALPPGFHGGALLVLLVQITHLGIATALLVLRLLALQRLVSAPPASSSVTTYDEETGEWVTVTTTATVTLSSLLQARVDAGVITRYISNDQAQHKSHIMMNFPTTHNKLFFGSKGSATFFTVFCEISCKQFLYHPYDFFSYRLILSLPSPPSFSRSTDEFVRRFVGAHLSERQDRVDARLCRAGAAV